MAREFDNGYREFNNGFDHEEKTVNGFEEYFGIFENGVHQRKGGYYTVFFRLVINQRQLFEKSKGFRARVYAEASQKYREAEQSKD